MIPTSETELAEAIRSAKGPLAVTGGGTRGLSPVGTKLSTAGLTGITLYEPGALTMVALAGTPVAEIEAALDAESQRLAFEPPDWRALLGTSGTPTIGGIFATNASGPRRLAVGAARDFLLGVRFVDGAGQLLKNGGRVMKNVTGYDLVKLMAGSHGTLGVMTEVSLKVLPKPEVVGELTVTGLDPKRAVAAMSDSLGSPWEVTGAGHNPAARTTCLRIEGVESSVSYRLARLTDRLAGYGDILTRMGDGTMWPRLRDMSDWAEMPGDVWRLSIRPSDAPGLIGRLPDGCEARLDWGGGLLWVRAPEGTDLRAALAPFNGHAIRLRGSGTIPRFHPEPAPLARLSKELRVRFDPRGILNQGLMG